MCAIEVAILFLILVSSTMIVELGFVEVLNMTSSIFQRWDFLESILFLSEWENKKWLENKSTNLLPGENLELNRLNDSKIPFSLLFVFIMGPLTFNFCLEVKFSIDSW